MHAHCTDSRKSGRKKEQGIILPGITTIAILTCPMQSFSMHITYKLGSHNTHATLYPHATSIRAFPQMIKYLWEK